jgi:hypothetical protein
MKGKNFEEKVARHMNGHHKGGPGNPDYTRGPIHGEVKDWKKRVGKSDLVTEARKGRNEIVSRQGFTKEAVDYRNRYRKKVKLYDWKARKYIS